MSARVTIAFSNQKGGVGKTTLTRELGLYLVRRGYRVLLVDSDPQGNLTKSLCDAPPEAGLADALDSGEVTELTRLSNHLTLLSGDIRLASLEKRLLTELDAYSRMRELFAGESFSSLDFILLDTPPSLSVLTVNALTAASHLLIPMRATLYSMQGTNDLMQTVAKVKKSLNPDLELLGVAINAYDSVPVITRQIRSEIEEAFGELVFQTVVRRSIRIEEAIAARTSVLASVRGHSVAPVQVEIASLGDEIIGRLEISPRGTP